MVDDALVIIDRNLTWTETDVVLGTLVVTNGATLELEGTTVITAENIVVSEGATISANGNGYPRDSGPGWSSSTGSGANHGGYGGKNSGIPYGSFYTPDAWGSGGDTHAGGGGAGGGAIHMVVSDTLTLNGGLLANGTNGGHGHVIHCAAGGGSGGSIWIEIGASGRLTGTGTIQANGGSGGSSQCSGGGGAGGRIAIYVPEDAFSGNIQAYGGWGSTYGGAGTIYLSKNGSSELLIDNANHNGLSAQISGGPFQFDNLTMTRYGHLEVDGDMTLTPDMVQGDDTATLTTLQVTTATGIVAFQNINITAKDKLLVTNTLNIYTTTLDIQGQLIGVQDVTLDNGGQLKLHAGSYLDGAFNLGQINLPNGTLTLAAYDNGDTVYDDGSDYGFTLEANNVNVGSGSAIEADGLGYNLNRGPGAHNSGASHAGFGGGNVATYGSVYSPVTLGSSGNNGRGGGAIHFVVSDTLTLNGNLRSNGINDGSGGSIWLDATTLTGKRRHPGQRRQRSRRGRLDRRVCSR